MPVVYSVATLRLPEGKDSVLLRTVYSRRQIKFCVPCITFPIVLVRQASHGCSYTYENSIFLKNRKFRDEGCNVGNHGV